MKKKRSFHGQSLWESKLLKVMKLTVLLMLISLMGVFASETYSQNTRLSVNANKMSLEDFLVDIENQSEFRFFYTGKIDVEQEVTGEFRNKKIFEILDEIKDEAGFQYEVLGRQIILSPNNVEGVIKSIQQQKTVSGIVTDESGQSLPGVTVVVKGTTQGSVTNADGSYTLANIPENTILIFSFVGMQTQEVEVGNQISINVTMTVDAIGIEEVVAIGYGTQKRSNVSGAISSVNSKELHSIATNSAGQALQGKVPMYITRSSGAPGSGTSIFLRGVGTMRSSSPLWIIDGVKGTPLENFQDVESIQVLKDAASTAIYGIEGANGVILVTTKKASKGKITVVYNGYTKVNSALGLPELLGTKEYSNMYVQRWKSNNPTLDPETSLKPFYLQDDNYYNQLPSTNWVDEMFRTGTDQVHALSVSGGNDKSSYLISLLHEDDKGTVVNTNYSKTSIKLKLNQQATKWLSFEETVDYKYVKDQPTINTLSDYAEDYIWFVTFRGNPAMNVYDSSNPMGNGYGYFTDDFMKTIDWQGNNPLESVMSADYWKKQEKVWGNFKMTVTPIAGLVWTTNISGAINNNWSSEFFYDNYGGASINTQRFTTQDVGKNQFNYDNRTTRNYFLSSVVDYSRLIGKNEIGVMVGAEVYQSEIFGSNGSARYGIPNEDFRTTQLADQANVSGNNYIGEDSGLSQFGRLTYSFDSKYLLTATFRNDASTKFAPGKRQAFFPALSLGWNIANEPFFKLDNINELKLRYGIGESGNDDVPSNLWRQEYSQNSSGSWQATKVVNEDITWEKTVTNNIGIDIGFLENSLTASVDLYEKKTRDALLKIALPTSTGFSNYFVNKGEIQNKGIELFLGYRKIINDFNFSVNGNVGYNKNTVLNLGDAAYLDGGSYNRTYENGPVSAFYGYVADGLYQSQSEIDELNANAILNGFDSYDGSVAPGDIKFEDLNGDGTITSDGDQQSIGNPWPKFIYGFNFNCSYKGLDFSMNWQGVFGLDVYNNTLQYTQNMFSDYNSTPAVFDAWSESKTNTTIPRLGNSTHNYGRSSSYMVEDGSYLRLKNLQIGYDLAKQFSKTKLKFQKFRIYAGMENALTFTKFKGFDPEFMSGDNYQRGVYYVDQYPQSRSVIFGIQLGF